MTPRRRKRADVEVLESRNLLSTLGERTDLFDHRPGRWDRLAPLHGVGLETIEKSSRRSGDHLRSLAGSNAAASVTYYDTSHVSIQPVSGWQGIRELGSTGSYLIAGTSDTTGLLFVGGINGQGTTYAVNYPGASNTSVYGPDDIGIGLIRMVGSYRTANSSTTGAVVNGFLYQGTTTAGNFRTIDYPGATYNYVHSTMGGLAVGNADGPTTCGLPLGPGKAYIYDVATSQFLTQVVFPGSTSNTAYGIWHNGGSSYTICGGYSDLSVNNANCQNTPIGQAYLVDYNSATGVFSDWKSFSYANGAVGTDYVTHFEGISSPRPGVYTISADSIQSGSANPVQGSFVTIKRNSSGGFGSATWVDLNYPGTSGVTSANSVAGNQVVGIVISGSGGLSYQATINPIG